MDIIFFVEDDYLWLPESVSEIIHILLKEEGVDYVTPYDHPVRYDKKFYFGVDLPHWNNEIYLGKSRHFRSQESTCMTFATRGKTIKEDINLHLVYSPEEMKCPNDRELFRRLQCLGGYNNAVTKRRLLVGPVPSLATHVHLPYLAPIIDWEEYARNLYIKYKEKISNL